MTNQTPSLIYMSNLGVETVFIKKKILTNQNYDWI